MRQVALILPGSVRSKKNSKQPTPISCKPGSKSTLFKHFAKLGMKPVRIMLQPSKAYKTWENEAHAAIRKQYLFPRLISSPVHVKAIAYIRGPAPDLSGMTESIGDCLQGVVIENDRQIKSWDGSRVYRDKDNPRTEVVIKPYVEDQP
jgi:hypothetical protein